MPPKNLRFELPGVLGISPLLPLVCLHMSASLSKSAPTKQEDEAVPDLPDLFNLYAFERFLRVRLFISMGYAKE